MSEHINGNPINNAHKGRKHSHSNFDLSHMRLQTSQFGKYTPCLGLEVVPDDGPIKIRPLSDYRSFSLDSPLLQDITCVKEYFQVPLQAILPNTHELITVNPVKGDDVVASNVNTVIENFPGKIITSLKSSWTALDSIAESADPGYIANAILAFLLKFEMFLSAGSLLSYFGVHYHSQFHFQKGLTNDRLSFDKVFDVLSQYFLQFGSVYLAGEDRTVVFDSASSVREFLDIVRQSSSHVYNFNDFTRNETYMVEFNNLLSTRQPIFDSIEPGYSCPLNYGRLCAYQIVCAHYFSNDKIDYIYTATLYRNYIQSLLVDAFAPWYGDDNLVFSWNGFSFYYDWLSGHFISKVLDNFLLSSLDFGEDYFNLNYPVLNAIFGYNYSLRYKDYFTGARAYPLAVGDVSVNTSGASVSVVDVTKQIARQRFLNSVARIGARFEEYVSKIFGTYVAPDWHDPKFLFKTQDKIYSSEVENTGDAQQTNPNSVTSVLRGRSSNYEFTVDIDRHSFIIGIEYYDIRRVYTSIQERNTMAVSRFDMFVPDLQYIGDQSLYVGELLAGVGTVDTPFGYQLRDMQFKQAIDQAFGGFVENLPGWSFSFNPADLYLVDNTPKIKPDFIRSKPVELDRYFIALTGFSPASYFHFIERVTFEISASRPMVVAPEIL